MSTRFQAQPAVLGGPAGSSSNSNTAYALAHDNLNAYPRPLPRLDNNIQACQNTHVAVANLGYMSPPAPAHYTQTQPHHGIKRSAPDDEVESTSNITGELKKLRLNIVRPSRIAPVHDHRDSKNFDSSSQQGLQDDKDGSALESRDDASRPPSGPPNGHGTSINDRHLTVAGTNLSYHASEVDQRRIRDGDRKNIDSNNDDENDDIRDNHNYSKHNDNNDNDDIMPVDETPNRVYISDLAREIAEIEADEDRHRRHNHKHNQKRNRNQNNKEVQTITLPEAVDEKISKIPLNVLRQSFDTAVALSSAVTESRPNNTQALILYRDPSSISTSLSEDEDVVRKAIVAARRDARARFRFEHGHEHGLGNPDDGGSSSTTPRTSATAEMDLISGPSRVRGLPIDDHEDLDEDAMDLG